MDTLIFEAIIGEEQVIRPPADLQIPPGVLEVTVRPVGSEKLAASSLQANENLRRYRAPLGRATGLDNETIDADLARQYGDATP